MRNTLPPVIFLCSWYPVGQDDSSGIFIRRQALALAESGISVLVLFVTTFQGEKIRFDERPPCIPGLKEVDVLLPIKGGGMLQKIWFFLNNRIEIRKQLHSYTGQYIDGGVLQVNVAYPAGILWWFFRDEFPSKITLAEHWSGYLPEDGRYNGIFRLLITSSLVRASKEILVVSEYLEKSMRQKGLSGKYAFLPNVVEEKVFVPGGCRGTVPFRFIHVSSLDAIEKQPELLVDAFSILCSRGIDATLTIVGGKANRIEELRIKVAQKSIAERVLFSGSLIPELVSKEMQKSNALVLSSAFEGQPVVVLEAQACGLPVVVPAVGGLPQMVDFSNGLLYEVGNTHQLASAMEKIILEYSRYDGAKIREKVLSRHSSGAVASYLSDIYRGMFADV